MPKILLNFYHKSGNQFTKLFFLNKDLKRIRGRMLVVLPSNFNHGPNPVKDIVDLLLSRLQVISTVSHPVVEFGNQVVTPNPIRYRLTAEVDSVGFRHDVNFFVEGDNVQFRFTPPDSKDYVTTMPGIPDIGKYNKKHAEKKPVIDSIPESMEQSQLRQD